MIMISCEKKKTYQQKMKRKKQRRNTKGVLKIIKMGEKNVKKI